MHHGYLPREYIEDQHEAFEERIEREFSKQRRVQRKRTKGWKMPPNTVYVGRGSKWGNPYNLRSMSRSDAIALFPDFIRRAMYFQPDLYNIGELRGKNLACWCPLDQPCHADVLLEMANKEHEK